VSNFIKIPLVLALVTFFTSGLLMFSESATRDKIAEQKKILLLESLKDLIPDALHDNDLTQDIQLINRPKLLGHRKQQALYIGTLNGTTTVLAVPVTARNGYSGDIDLMVGIKNNGEITAVKILEQHETPGLGDLIQANKSDWLKQFPTLSLKKIGKKHWKVKRDGGQFDQITGATITPRAIVAAIKQALKFQQEFLKTANKDEKEDTAQ
jgi:electron transport complex protein RnfG